MPNQPLFMLSPRCGLPILGGLCMLLAKPSLAARRHLAILLLAGFIASCATGRAGPEYRLRSCRRPSAGSPPTGSESAPPPFHDAAASAVHFGADRRRRSPPAVQPPIAWRQRRRQRRRKRPAGGNPDQPAAPPITAAADRRAAGARGISVCQRLVSPADARLAARPWHSAADAGTTAAIRPIRPTGSFAGKHAASRGRPSKDFGSARSPAAGLHPARGHRRISIDYSDATVRGRQEGRHRGAEPVVRRPRSAQRSHARSSAHVSGPRASRSTSAASGAAAAGVGGESLRGRAEGFGNRKSSRRFPIAPCIWIWSASRSWCGARPKT